MPRYSESDLRRVVSESDSLTAVLRRFGLRPAGGNFALLKRWIAHWGISIEHFTLDREMPRRGRIPLEAILVRGSTFNRGHLKDRLYEEGVKDRRCELCGQDEEWRGLRMALILDHINGVPDDNRIENLRIVCPNCAATFDTHCGRQNRIAVPERLCPRCNSPFRAKSRTQRYCSRSCASRYDRRGVPKPTLRRAQRPPYEQLLAEVAAEGYRAVGRRHGVSDNAVRTWVRAYERERAGAPDGARDDE